MYLPYQDLLTALAEETGLEAASLIATEEIVIDDLLIGLQLKGEGDDAEVLLCSQLGTVSPGRWNEVARALLLANHLWTGTGGATLGLLPDDDTVSLSVRQPLRDLDANKLAVLLAKTTDIGLAWQDFINRDPGAPEHAALPDVAAGLRV